MTDFDFIYLAAAFGGGVFGAAFGAVIAFVLCGFLAVIGAGVTVAMGAAPDAAAFSNLVAWGPYLGPHVAFGAGVVAAAYAGRVGKLDSGKNIGATLIGLNAPDVLAVGGIFGALGYVWYWVIATYGPALGDFAWVHPVVGSLVINSVLARLLFGKSGLFGKVKTGASRWVPSDAACWLRWQETPPQVLLIGLAVALPTAFVISKLPAAMDFSFGLPALWLTFLVLGMKTPVAHHIGFIAGFAVLALGNFWWGVAFGVFAAYAAQLLAPMFLNHGDTHIDPPVMSIFVSWAAVVIVAFAGAKSAPEAVAAAVAVAVAVVGYGVLVLLSSAKSSPTPQAATPA